MYALLEFYCPAHMHEAGLNNQFCPSFCHLHHFEKKLPTERFRQINYSYTHVTLTEGILQTKKDSEQSEIVWARVQLSSSVFQEARPPW